MIQANLRFYRGVEPPVHSPTRNLRFHASQSFFIACSFRALNTDPANMASTALPPTLADAASWASPAEIALLHKLLEEDQGHLFAGFRPGQDVPQKKAFLEQVGLRSAGCAQSAALSHSARTAG